MCFAPLDREGTQYVFDVKQVEEVEEEQRGRITKIRIHITLSCFWIQPKCQPVEMRQNGA